MAFDQRERCHLYYTEISKAEPHTSGAVDRPRAQAAAESTEPQKDAKRTHEHDMDSESECEDSSPVKNANLGSLKCLGTSMSLQQAPSQTPVVPKLSDSSNFTTTMSKAASFTSILPATRPRTSQAPNWSKSSRESRLTSTRSSCPSITLHWMRRGRRALEEQQSLLAQLNHLGRFPLRQNGLLPGDELHGLSHLPSPTTLTNWTTTLKASSPQSMPLPTNTSYGMSPLSETLSMEGSLYCSPTPSVSSTSTLRSSSLMAYNMEGGKPDILSHWPRGRMPPLQQWCVQE